MVGNGIESFFPSPQVILLVAVLAWPHDLPRRLMSMFATVDCFSLAILEDHNLSMLICKQHHYLHDQRKFGSRRMESCNRYSQLAEIKDVRVRDWSRAKKAEFFPSFAGPKVGQRSVGRVQIAHGEKHMCKSKSKKSGMFGLFFEVFFCKDCTLLLREAHLQIKFVKTDGPKTFLDFQERDRDPHR